MAGKPPGLLDMPPTVIQNIAEFVGFPGVQNMRKVCGRLLHILNSYPPALSLESVHISMPQFKYEAIYTISDKMYTESSITTRYRPYCVGATVQQASSLQDRPAKDLRRKRAVTLFCNDLILNLFKHKAKIDKFTFAFDCKKKRKKFLETFPTLLRPEHQIKVESFEMIIYKKEDIFSILPYCNPNVIKVIKFGKVHYRSIFDRRELTFKDKDVDRLAALECWKKAEKIRIYDNISVESSESLRHFHHFKMISLRVEWLMLDDLIRLKKAMKKPNSKLRSATVSYNHFVNLDYFKEILGPYGNPWHFDVQNLKFIVEVSSYHICIDRVKKFPKRVIVSHKF